MIKTNWLSCSYKIVLIFALALPAIEATNAPALSQGVQPWNKNCKKLFKKWEAARKHKAFATTNPGANPDGQACGSSWGYATKNSAESSAVAACRKQQGGSCWVIRSE